MNASPKRVLVVEDQRLVAADLEDTLKRLGYDVVGNVASGEAAIPRAIEARPDLALMDIRLRGEIDGIQAATAIQERMDIPVIYLTAYADEQTIRRAMVTGPFGYLVKPFNERELQAAIDIAIYKHASDRLLAEERARRQAAEEFKFLVEGVEDYAIFLVDLAGRVTTWNVGAERIKGYMPAEIIGRHVSVFYTPEDVQAGKPETVLKAAIEQGRSEDEGWRVRKDGSQFWANVTINALRDEQGQVRGFAKVTRDMTARRAAELELMESLARTEQILNQIPTGVLIAEAPASEISFVNKRCQEILGQYPGPSAPASEYNGWNLFHLDGRPYRLEETPRYRALRGEQVVDEFKVQRPDGSWVMVRAQAAPLRDHTGRIQSSVVAFDDISRQKRYEEILRFLSEASRQLAESIDYETTLAQIARLAVPGIADWFAVDLLRDGELSSIVVAHSDPAKVELAKELRRRFPPDLEATRGVAKVLRDGQPELYEDISDELLAGAARSDDHFRVMRELDMKSAMVVALNVRGRTIGAVSFFSGESGRRYDRSDLEAGQGLADRAAMAIENARLFREAERAIRLREEVLAVVSHDLRNPLSSIDISAAMLFNKSAPDPGTRKQLETILRAAGRMKNLLDDLLDMASIQAGRLAVERKAQEIAPIIAEAVEIAEPLAKANGETLSSEIAVGVARCSVDRDRVLQLFSNLLGNAKKFCPTDGSITVRAIVKGNEVECSVSDTGPGIPEKDLPHIFAPYWSAKHQAKKGVGLGLYISKGIVEAHGGRIWVENQVGSGATGATFFFTLPLA